MNQTQKPPTNLIKKNITPNSNFNRGNNINQGRNPNSNMNNNNNIISGNDELGKAILIIRRECKKKDDRIRELEKKVND